MRANELKALVIPDITAAVDTWTTDVLSSYTFDQLAGTTTVLESDISTPEINFPRALFMLAMRNLGYGIKYMNERTSLDATTNLPVVEPAYFIVSV